MHEDIEGERIMVQRLKVVAGTDTNGQAQVERSPVECVFDHWVYMLGKNPRRVAMGPKRRRAIERALQLYDVETLLLAVEGCAASPYHRGENDRDTEYTDLELILRDEPHIERFVEAGERLRERADMAAQRARERAALAGQAPMPTAEETERRRAYLRRAADAMAGRAAR
jgi:hypothetical protein